MRNSVLSCIYIVIRDFPDSPFNARMISETCGLKATDVKAVFINLQKEGIIRKKHRILSHTFRITEAGIEEAKNAWQEEQQKKKD
jgi:predicted transcriptional regulator